MPYRQPLSHFSWKNGPQVWQAWPLPEYDSIPVQNVPGAGRTDDREELAVAQGEADIPQHLAGALKLFADMDRLQHEIPPEDGYASMDFKSAWAARSPS